MAKSKNLTLIFPNFSKEHWGKDPFLVAYYLGKRLNCESVTIVRYKKDSKQEQYTEVRGVSIISLPNTFESHRWYINIIPFLNYLRCHAKEIDFLMLYYDNVDTRFLSSFYKKLNPSGKCYVKMDVNPYKINDTFANSSYIKKTYYAIVDKMCKKAIDVISCETKTAYQLLNKSRFKYHHWGNKLVYMPNGFDEELLKSMHIKERNFREKEKLMITVGRLGTRPKNTQMLLDVFSKVDLKTWKVLLIGPVEDGFRKTIEKFYDANSEKKDKVLFIGSVFNKKELWEYYNRSKVFLLSSNYESYGLVLVEARRFRNYIISTNVGAALDLTESGHYGKVVPVNDVQQFSEEVQKIINGETNIEIPSTLNANHSLSWENCVDIVAKKLLRS